MQAITDLGVSRDCKPIQSGRRTASSKSFDVTLVASLGFYIESNPEIAEPWKHWQCLQINGSEAER